MAERDRTAIDIETCRIGIELLQPCDRHGGEGFVDFVKVDVVDLHTGFGQRLFGARDRSFEHDDRIAAHHCHVMHARERLDAKLLEAFFIDDHDA